MDVEKVVLFASRMISKFGIPLYVVRSGPSDTRLLLFSDFLRAFRLQFYPCLWYTSIVKQLAIPFLCPADNEPNFRLNLYFFYEFKNFNLNYKEFTTFG